MSSALIHHVWFKWKAAATPEQISAACTALLALKTKIDVIVDISCGVNITDRSKGFTHGLTVKFADAAHLPVYANHAEHLKVVNDHIAPIREETMALDYVENKW